jgi:GTP1/Obg family GTP-binding protein
MGWNLRCAFPSFYRDQDTHQLAMDALAQIMAHFPKLRRLIDEVEAEVLNTFVTAQAVEKADEQKREAMGMPF